MNNWKLKFAAIWGGQAVSIFTSAIMKMALIWHLAITTNSALVMAIASIAAFLPQAFLGTVAGALVDKYSRKLVIIGADLYIAGIALSLVVFALFADVPVWFVMVVLFLRSIGTSFHTPAISAITPLIVPENHLTKVAGYTSSLQSLGFIAGMSVAAILYPLWGIAGMVMMDVGGALAASGAVAIVKIPALPKVSAENTELICQDEHKAGIWHDILESYNVIKSNKGLFALLWISAGFTVAFAPINALFPLMSMDHFGGTTTHASIAEIMFGAGMMGGGIIVGIWGGFKNRGIGMGIAIALMGIAISISGLLPPSGFVFFAAMSALMGLSAPLYSAPHMALMQEKIPPEFLGRIFGLYGSLMSFTMLLGLALSGLLADMVGINIWFFLGGAGIILLAIVTLALPSIRGIDKAQEYVS